jgi:hypothetical protein
MKILPVFLLTTGFAVVVQKVMAQPTQPSLPASAINAATQAQQNPIQSLNQGMAGLANSASIATAQGIYDQMRAGNELVIKSELFSAIVYVTLIVAFVAIAFISIDWLLYCKRTGFLSPDIIPRLFVPIILIIVLTSSVAQGFGMQNMVLGTQDLFDSFQTYILQQGSTASGPGGSAVQQANTKALAEQTIREGQQECYSKLDESKRTACFQQAYEQVLAQLNPYLSRTWGQQLAQYAEDTLITNGANTAAPAATNNSGSPGLGASLSGGALGGAALGQAISSGGANPISSVVNGVTGLATAALSPGLYAGLLLINIGMGLLIEILKTFSGLFLPFSIAISLFPVARGSWILWFKGIFGIWISGLFLRILITVIAIVTVAGSSISGEIYVITSFFITIVCAIMGVLSFLSSLTGIARNVTENIASYR